MSDMALTKIGTVTAKEDRYMEWKTKDGNYENTAYAQFDTFYEGMFDLTAIVYFLSVISLFVFLTVQAVEKRRWS